MPTGRSWMSLHPLRSHAIRHASEDRLDAIQLAMSDLEHFHDRYGAGGLDGILRGLAVSGLVVLKGGAVIETGLRQYDAALFIHQGEAPVAYPVHEAERAESELRLATLGIGSETAVGRDLAVLLARAFGIEARV